MNICAVVLVLHSFAKMPEYLSLYFSGIWISLKPTRHLDVAPNLSNRLRALDPDTQCLLEWNIGLEDLGFIVMLNNQLAMSWHRFSNAENNKTIKFAIDKFRELSRTAATKNWSVNHSVWFSSVTFMENKSMSNYILSLCPESSVAWILLCENFG